MAKLPKKRKLLPEELPKEKFLPELLTYINGFFDDVTSALNKSLTFQENLASEILAVYIDGVYPLDVKWTNRSRPIAAWIGSCREVSGNHVTFTDPISLDWEMVTNDKFRINAVPGLSASSTNPYKLVIIAIIG